MTFKPFTLVPVKLITSFPKSDISFFHTVTQTAILLYSENHPFLLTVTPFKIQTKS